MDAWSLEEACKTEEVLKKYIVADVGDVGDHPDMVGDDPEKQIKYAFKALFIACRKRDEYKDPMCQLGVCGEGKKPKQGDYLVWPRC